jgi:hypothetical protein
MIGGEETKLTVRINLPGNGQVAACGQGRSPEIPKQYSWFTAHRRGEDATMVKVQFATSFLPFL